MEVYKASQLPTEVLENIFCLVDIGDVPSLAASCTRFSSLLKTSNKVWKNLFWKR